MAQEKCVHKNKRLVELSDKIQEAINIAYSYGQVDGAHHKMWVIDQMLQKLLGPAAYKEVIRSYEEGPDGETYEWDPGIAP